MLQAVAQAIGQRADPRAHFFGPNAVMEVNCGVQACEQRHIPRPILHEPVHPVLVVVPFGAIEGGPELVLALARDVKHAVTGRREQPFVGAREISVAPNILHIHFDLADAVRAVNYREALVVVRQRGKALDRHDDRRRGNNVREREHARPGRDGLGVQADQLVGIVRRHGHLNLFPDNPVALGAQLPAAHASRMLLVGGDDFIARFQVEPMGEEVHPHRGVLDEPNFHGVRVDQLGELLPQRHFGRVAADPIRHERAPVPAREGGLKRSHVLDHALEDGPRRRADCAGVEVSFAGLEIELFAQPIPKLGVGIIRPRWDGWRRSRLSFGAGACRNQRRDGKGAEEMAAIQHGVTSFERGWRVPRGFRRPMEYPRSSC